MVKKIKMEEMATRIAHQILEKVRVVKDSLPVIGHKKKKNKENKKNKNKKTAKVGKPKKTSRKSPVKKKRATKRGRS